MNKVTIIKPINLYSSMMGESKGALMNVLIWVALPICILVSIFMLFGGNGLERFMGGLVFLFCGAVAITVFNGGNYKPEKSFVFYRLSKDKMRMIMILGGLVTILLLIVIITLYGFSLNRITWLIIIPLILYYINKTYELHEDVDFVTNMEVSELLGMEVDEKIQASYQNYDSSDIIKSGSNMIVVTDKRVIFAFNNGENWEIANKKINDIVKIGHGVYDDKSYLKLVFSDKTAIGLHMGLYNKLTSNPSLFFRKFLIVLDTALLGKTDEKIASRRRVSVNNEPKTSVNSNDEGINVRTIDLSETILCNLRNATIIEPGRTLDL